MVGMFFSIHVPSPRGPRQQGQDSAWTVTVVAPSSKLNSMAKITFLFITGLLNQAGCLTDYVIVRAEYLTWL
jgi:hypothetical protein